MATYLISNFRGGNGKVYQINFDWIANAGVPGQFIEVDGRCEVVRPKAKKMFETVRGSELKMYFSVVNEQDRLGIRELSEISGDKEVRVRLFENGARIWEGWLKPDGILESFVFDRYEIEMSALDGLGLLENIKYLKPNGDPYFGKAKELDILARCLKLTGLIHADLWFYHFDLFFATEDLLVLDLFNGQAIVATYVNQERYYKDDEASSGFSCKEVIDGILKKYGAYVCYENDNFHVKRIAYYYNDSLNTARRSKFNLNGQLLIVEPTYNKKQTIGSQINNAEVFHAGGSSQVIYNGSLGAYKAVYKYGGVRTIIANSKLIYDLPQFNTVSDWVDLVDGLRDYNLDPEGWRVRLKTDTGQWYPPSPWLPPSTVVEVLQTNDLPDLDVSAGDALFVEFKGEAYVILASIQQIVEVAVIGDDTTYYLRNDGQWSNTQTYFRILNEKRIEDLFFFKYDITTEELPINGRLRVSICRPNRKEFYNVLEFAFPSRALMYSKITEVNINANIEGTGIKGESYTAKITNKPISIVEVEDEIYVGDSDSDVYVGAIENVLGANTFLWEKKTFGSVLGGSVSGTPRKLLEWLVRDRLMVQQGNQKEFEGSMYGKIEYIKLLNIDGFDNTAFMFNKWKWDIAENTVEFSAVSVFNQEIADNEIDVEFQYETENVVKPTIVG